MLKNTFGQNSKNPAKPESDKITSEVLPDFLNLIFKRYLMPVRCLQ